MTGSEARADTGEPSASSVARPHNVQALSACFVLEEGPEVPECLVEPEGYARVLEQRHLLDQLGALVQIAEEQVGASGQEYLIDPTGRFFEIELRKLF